MHHFDGQGNAEKAWLPCPETCYGKECWCANIRDRLSASLLNAQLPKVNGKIPNYADVNVNAASGLILNPSFTKVLCAYPHECVALAPVPALMSSASLAPAVL